MKSEVGPFKMIDSILNGNVDYSKYYLNRDFLLANNANFTNAPASQKPLSAKQKGIILASSAAGMLPVLATLAKMKGFSLNPAQILKTPIKDWALFKFAPKDKIVRYEGPEILAIASSSVAGGYVGGSIVDKENKKSKKREVLNQILGNVAVPVGCVWGGSEIFNRFSDKLIKTMPTVKDSVKGAKVINKISQIMPQTFFTLAFLSIGIYLGNKVSNFINDHLYHKKVDRNIKATDFAPHVDDICLAASLMDKGSLGDKIGRVIPFALLVPGYQTGIAREK